MISFSHSILFLLFFATILKSQGDATAPPELKSFPLKESLWLSMSKSHVAPAESVTLHPPFEGYLQINVPNHTFLKKDQVWAIKAPKRLNFSQESLDLEDAQVTQNMKEAQLNHLDAVSSLEDKLANLMLEAGKLRSALENPRITQNSKIRKPLQSAIEKITAAISRDRERLLDLNSKTTLRTQVAQFKLALKKKQADHEQLQKTSELTAPFDGTLDLQIPKLPEAANEYPASVWINSSDPLGTLSNNTRFEVSIKVSNSELFQVNKQTLFVKINNHSQKNAIRANYFRTQQVENQSSFTAPTLVFQVITADTIKAQDLSGSQPIAHIYTELPKNCHIVPKSALIPYLNQQEDQSNWKGTTEKLWPNSQLIAIGKTALAVQASSH